jgi:Kef-type K+ transport system membrane component KefB
MMTMRRLLAGAAGVLLVVIPPLMLYGITVPVPQYRTGTFADYEAFVVSCLTVYGGVALGITVRWLRDRRKEPIISGRSVFRAGFTGALVVIGIALVLASMRSGSLGNLWGLVVIFGGVFAATVSAGARLVWYAIRPDTVDSQLTFQQRS